MSIDEILTPEALNYYYDHPVDFVNDLIIKPACTVKPGTRLSRQQRDMLNAIRDHSFTGIESAHSCGKAIDKSRTIYTPDGAKKFGDIKVGDYVFARNGSKTKVTGVYEQGVKPTYRVTFDDHSYTECCGEHLWTVKSRNDRRHKKDWDVLSTEDIIKKGVRRKNGKATTREFIVPFTGVVDFNAQDVPFDPYAIGVWLGDGSCHTPVYSKADSYIADRITASGISVKKYAPKNGCYRWHISGILPALRETGLFECISSTKFIPSEYLFNTPQVRHAVLQGLMDTDGTVYPSGLVVFASTSKTLCENVAWIARSLGGKAYTLLSPQKSGYKKDGEYHQCNDCYEVSIRMPDDYPPFSLPRKISVYESRKQTKRSCERFIESIEPVGEADCMCITVEDEEHLFLIDDFIPTHNSTGYAFAAYWFTTTRHNPVDLTKVRVCANSYNQLFDILWPELKRWLSFSPLKELFLVEERTICIPVVDPKTGKINKAHTYIAPVSPANPDNLQGAHAGHLLWLIDEAFGIQDNLVWETIEGSITEEDNKLCFAGQHTTLRGYCHDAFHRNKALWKTLRFSAFDSPFAKKEYIERIEKKYGKESNVYRIRVLGTEPTGQSDSFLPYDKVQDAMNRERPKKRGGTVELGIDCARFGDDNTVITAREGLYVYPQTLVSKADSYQIVREVKKTIRSLREDTGFADTIRIKIDATGGHGSGVIDMLNREKELNIEVVPIVYSGGGGDDVYANITSLMWGEIKDVIDDLVLPNDEFLMEELVSRTYDYANGKIKIQDKGDYKKKHDGLSPDRSDSLCLCLTGAKAINRVFNQYVTSNPRCHNAFDVSWATISFAKYQVYVVITMLGNTAYGSFYLYDAENDILRQYDEFVIDKPTAETIKMALKNKAMCALRQGESNGMYVKSIYSDNMSFGGGRDLSYKLSRDGVRMREAIDYDRQGAILHLNALLTLGKCVIHDRCESTDRQLSEWAISSNGSPERGYPLCGNLLLITSVVRKMREEAKKEAPRTGYSKENKSTMDKILGALTGSKKKTGWEFMAK